MINYKQLVVINCSKQKGAVSMKILRPMFLNILFKLNSNQLVVT